MKIISHRGKYNKESLENNISTIATTDKHRPDYIEIDVQLNKLGKIVLVHNSISTITYPQQVKLPQLKDLLLIKLKSNLLIEVKQPGIAKKVLSLLHKADKASFTTFSLEDALYIKNNSEYEVFIMQRIHPIGLIKKCTINGLDGIGMNKNWLLLVPFIYFRCLKNEKKIFLYTVNSKILAKYLSKLMPKIHICTDETKKLLGY